MTRRYGYKKGAPSPSDYKLSARLGAVEPPPPRASLADRAGGSLGVLDQMRQDCVPNAVMGAIQVCMTTPSSPLAPLGSRDWAYYLSGLPTGDQLNDDGRYIRDCFSALRQVGWPDEGVWPYGRWPEHPGQEEYREAFHRRRLAYHFLADGEGRKLELMQAIAAGFPVVGGLQVTQGFEDQDGVTPCELDLNQEILGGHAVRFLAYDEHGARFCNSWGQDWGAEGWGYLSWGYVTSGYSSEFVAVELTPEAA